MTELRKTILLMDDSEIVLETLKAVLEPNGLNVRTASSLADLETELAACTPDLVVLDVQMPEAFGYDVGIVLREVRQINVPILLFSSLDDATLAARVKESELDGFVSKNAGVGALLARVTSILAPKGGVA